MFSVEIFKTNSNDQNSKDAFSSQLRNLLVKSGYSPNLGLTDDEVMNLSSNDLVGKVDKLLKSVQSTIYPLGLHALGQYWNENDLASTVSVMMSYDFTLDNNKGETNLCLK